MRVLFYEPDHGWSGRSRVALTAAAGLAQRKHPVTIVSPGSSRLARLAPEHGIELASVEREDGSGGTFRNLRRVLQDRFVEVVFVASEQDLRVVSSAARFASRGAIIRRVPSFSELRAQAGDRLARRMTSAGLLFSSAWERDHTSVSGWSIPPAVAPLGVDPGPYETIQAAPLARVGLPAGGTLIACVYEPSGRVRVATVFRTLALLVARHPHLRVVVVGPGSADEGLRMHAAALGVSSFVSFVGEQFEMAAVLRAADAVWVVASDDGGAYGFLDAMALRLPVIADRQPLAERYVADGITGILLTSEDPSLTASAVAAFLAHPARRQAMGQAGRTRVQREFSDTAMIDGFEAAAEAAAERSKTAR